MPKRLLLIALSMWGCVVSAAPISARTEQVEAQLLASHAVVQPGQRLTVGLRQRIAPHWHTYWRNPGDSGQATSIEWSLPAGAAAGEIEWPAPSRQAIGPITNYGYEQQVVLLAELTVPADARPGGQFAATARVNWLVCKDICIPQQVELGLDLPVAVVSLPGSDAQELARARAKLPQASPWPVQLQAGAQGLTLRWPAAAPTQAWFFAETWGVVAHSAPQPLARDGEQWALQLPAGEAPLAVGKALTGVLVLTGAEGARAYRISTTVAGPGAAPTGDAPGLAAALLLALAGGLVLNLMPCVFPVLSIKALGLMAAARDSARVTRRHGLAYTLGVLASFALLAAVLIALRAAGAEIGWGFQFQSPLFVLGVAYVLFAVGLSLSGLFDIGASVTGLGSGLAEKPGYTGSFFTGVLATVVATPCTAPFMGAALAFALAQPAPQLLAVFLSLGLGLALPYLALSLWPALQRWLPRPGAWMNTLKQGLAFAMYAAAVWLIWVLAQQTGPDGVLVALAGMTVIAFALWLRGVLASAWVGNGLAGLLIAFALAGGAWLPQAGPAPPAANAGFEAYTPERLRALRAEGRPVFVNLTAAWCISCLVNERVALSRPEVAAAFQRAGITYLKGDWTHQDARISALLAEYGRSGVPLYLYFPAGVGTSALVLPQLLTPGIVIDALATPVRPSKE
ncbi:protein-disulfide reductase DsbD family protein [Roseateles toxinivorans]|uniref:Thiol:disulfide interchange protein DsbD n=1 Tax=Roseateles toxinivorans TaxID=270368 RepID=A0A4R6QHG3_9BURK|nr:protein-disulfide reductase DsbD domain-containing protein [Roseateles toxinivorans]TDP61527.1 thiol:disulfide interchange protein DsbD [Roseateles toxinivorans]